MKSAFLIVSSRNYLLSISTGNHLTIGCTATNFPPLRGSKPTREPGVISQRRLRARIHRVNKVTLR